ncbi:RNA polymerase recycling motor HelD [Pontibacillus salicampi]|uniref:RNA polymerase recycling motor HelD n=1 Tax=Pontibacillus salicampi TaxID=1449801 RepID=A0ABV6LPT9_9BACI
MSKEKHEDWQLEQQRVDKVVEEIDQKQETLQNKIGGVKGEVIDLRENFFEDITVNMDEPDDVLETHNSIRQQAELLGERERSHRHFYDQLKTLKRLKNSPYFGRIDFHEDGDKEGQAVYIGLASLMDQEEEHFLIYDWRAPISSLYYDYSPGRAAYMTPEGEVEGDMTLKRQFIIRNSELKGVFDTGVTIWDDLLQEVLGGNVSTRMKSIVSTIQKEQNEIIRYNKKRYLLVQGVAGSGKTSAALQRVAYLLYRYRGSIQADQIMLFSPNPMFNSYVANVLPELGEDNMQQTTFLEYIDKRLSDRFDYEDVYSQLEYLLTSKKDEAYTLRFNGIQYKASLSFKALVDNYLKDLTKAGMVFRNIKFKGKTIVAKEEIRDYFYSLDDAISTPNAMEMLVSWILQQVKAFEKKERTKGWVEEEIQHLSKEDYLKIHHQTQAGYRGNEDTFDDHIREQRILSKAVVQKYMKPLKRKIQQLQFVHMEEIYKNVFQYHPSDAPADWAAIAEDTIQALEEKKLYHEDVTPFLYLEDQIKGVHVYTNIRYLFIDEAQDYSPFQFAFLKQLFPYSRMTILGDYNQAINAHNVTTPNPLSEDMHNQEEMEKLTLLRSYRSTKPIVEFTKHIVAGGEDIEPFNRDGISPTVTRVQDAATHMETIEQHIQAMQNKEYETIAIICKTANESRHAYDALKHDFDVKLMDKDHYTFEKGLMIIPAYLAKGIEFDAVLLFNASKEQYSEELERNLFYTACTRAMHELHLVSFGEYSPFITAANHNTYEAITIPSK